MYVTLDGYIVKHATERAVGLVKEGSGLNPELIWVPRSCVENGDDIGVGDVDVVVEVWIAKSKGLDH